MTSTFVTTVAAVIKADDAIRAAAAITAERGEKVFITSATAGSGRRVSPPRRAVAVERRVALLFVVGVERRRRVRVVGVAIVRLPPGDFRRSHPRSQEDT